MGARQDIIQAAALVRDDQDMLQTLWARVKAAGGTDTPHTVLVPMPPVVREVPFNDNSSPAHDLH